MEQGSSSQRCSVEIWDAGKQQWNILRTFDSLELADTSIRANWEYNIACLQWFCGALYQLSRDGGDDLQHIRVRLLIG